MKLFIDKNSEEINAGRIAISINDEVEFYIYFNSVNELTIRKKQFGSGESALTIKPSVSNEIRLT